MAANLSNLKANALPPAGFDARTASGATLAKYGLPTRPDPKANPKQAAHWDKVFSKKLTFITPEFKAMEELLPGVTKPASTAGTAGTTNSHWSGTVVQTTSADPFKSISGLFNVADVVPPGPGAAPTGTYWMVSWIGIDGWGSNDVCQVGTVQSATLAANGAITRNCYAWTEWYPQSWIGIANFPINLGDTISALVCIISTTKATFSMVNETTGTSVSFDFTAPAGTTLAGTSAEWIVERPGIGGGLSTLANYGDVYFNNAVANTNSGKSLNAGTGLVVNMVENNITVSTTTVETPTLISIASTNITP